MGQDIPAEQLGVDPGVQRDLQKDQLHLLLGTAAVGAGHAGQGLVFLPVAGGAPDGQVTGVLLLGGEGSLQQAGGHGVVRVKEVDPLGIGGGQTRVAGAGGPAVGLVDHGKPAVPPGPLVADRAAAVGGAVVHQHAFPAGKGLGGDGGQADRQKLAGVPHRHHDGQFRGVGHGGTSSERVISNRAVRGEPACPGGSKKLCASFWPRIPGPAAPADSSA